MIRVRAAVPDWLDRGVIALEVAVSGRWSISTHEHDVLVGSIDSAHHGGRKPSMISSSGPNGRRLWFGRNIMLV